MKINPELNVDDKVKIIHMEGEKMAPGTKGIVLSVGQDPFYDDGFIYDVKWEDGRKMAIVTETDYWILDEENINEDTLSDAKWFMENKDLLNNFNIKFLMDFLLKLKDSGVVNMAASAPYLYMGREKIAHEFYYNEPENSEDFQEVLDMADEAQSIMINGVMKMLDDLGKDNDETDINRVLKFTSSKIVFIYILFHKK
jgi:hypothetical protein